MKYQSIYLLLLPAFMLVSGCSDSEQSEPEQVPIELRASESRGGVVAKADQSTDIKQVFETTLFASKRDGEYTGLTPTETANEWTKDAEVAVGGAIRWTDNTSPAYPEYGEWQYLVAVAPKVAQNVAEYNSDAGTVTYTLTGQTDLMYAGQIRGNRWDGSRFSENTNGSVNPLIYRHLLTQLKFKAKKAASNGLTVQVKSISVAGAGAVTLKLSDGTTTFATDTKTLACTLPDGGQDISSDTPVDLNGLLLLPPLAKGGAYRLTVETSVGTFEDLDIVFNSSSDPAGEHFAAGHSYEITLEISDRELEVISVSVADWTTVAQNGELNLVDQ